MAHYLVSARVGARIHELEDLLERGEIRKHRPFGEALAAALAGARLGRDGRVMWEEEDYCTPRLDSAE